MADTDTTRADAAAEGEVGAYLRWRAAVLEHERMCIAVDIYTPHEVYVAYLAARTREIDAALALRAAVAPRGLGVLDERAVAPAPSAADGEE